MTQIGEISGHGFLTRYGKRQVATSTYLKGKTFVGAAILLRRQGDSEQIDHVVLHLLCQGIEGSLKGLLLLRDYDRFIVRLRKPLGHDLVKVAREAALTFSMKPMRRELIDELKTLSNLYSQHLLRYGSGYDILVDPRTIPRQRVMRRIGAVVRLAERELKRLSGVI